MSCARRGIAFRLTLRHDRTTGRHAATILRRLACVLALLLPACTAESRGSGAHAEFVEQTRAFQRMYMGGGEHCPELLAMLNDSIRFWENGEEWSRAQLDQFCPHLPRKNVVETVHRHRVLAPGLAHDFVTQLYIRERGDTIRESASRIWQKSDDGWQVVEMNTLRERFDPGE